MGLDINVTIQRDHIPHQNPDENAWLIAVWTLVYVADPSIIVHLMEDLKPIELTIKNKHEARTENTPTSITFLLG